MIPYEVDPSLHPAQPAPPQLDDGFSPPGPLPPAEGADVAPDVVDPSLWQKSEF